MPRISYKPLPGAGFKIGPTGRRTWPAWFTALGATAGVYIIRQTKTKKALYVGRSFANLRKTISRHFQDWSGPTAGALFTSGAHAVTRLEVGIIAMPAGTTEKKRQAILDEERKQIKRQDPEENKYETGGATAPEYIPEEEVPF